MPTVTTRSRDAGPLLARREPFTTYGTLSACDIADRTEPGTTGRLPHEWAERFRSDAQEPGLAYVVRSYATPIGWVRTDGTTVIPGDVRYSATTARHQTLCRRWL